MPHDGYDDGTPPEPPPLHAVPNPPNNTPHEDPYADRYTTPTTPRRDASHDPAAEQAVLGALLLTPTAIDDVRTQLTPTDFYRPELEQLYTVLLDHHDNSQPIDPITIGDHLLRTGIANQPIWRRLGGITHLHDLQAACPVTVHLPHYINIVRDHARLRTAAAAIEHARNTLADATPDTLYDAIGTAMDGLEDAVRRDGTQTTTNTGLRDLTWLRTGDYPVQAPPAWAHRTDGHALFYNGKVNGVFGDPESGKTWLAQTAIVEALNTGHTAAMIDVDHNGMDHTAARLLLLGAHLDHLADPNRFRYYEPEDGTQLTAAVGDITTWHPAVYVLDSLGEVLPMLGVKSVDNDEITAALRQVCTPPAAAGCCVITIDHLPKNPDARGSGYAIGGTAKKRMMRGSYLRVEVRTQPAPGQIGRSTIRIEKDTVGELRKVTPGGYAGTLILDSTHSETHGITRWSIDREQAPIDAAGHFRPTDYMERVSKFIEDNDQVSGREIEDSVGGTSKHVRTALKVLIDEGFVTTMPGTGRRAKATLHHSIALYRKAEDDNA